MKRPPLGPMCQRYRRWSRWGGRPLLSCHGRVPAKDVTAGRELLRARTGRYHRDPMLKQRSAAPVRSPSRKALPLADAAHPPKGVHARATGTGTVSGARAGGGRNLPLPAQLQAARHTTVDPHCSPWPRFVPMAGANSPAVAGARGPRSAGEARHSA